MVMYFFYPIQQCAQQIYHTALPLSPKSSLLRQINQQMVSHDQVPVTGFVDPPSDWGLLLTTINVGSRRPTSITTFAEKIAVACEDIVNIYDAVTFALGQSFHTPQSVTSIQGSGDGSILVSAHSRSVTSWDIQTGGLIDTLNTRSEINDMVISQTAGHIACGLSDGSVAFWNAHTKIEGSFGNSQPVVTVCWLSSAELVVATKSSIYIADIVTGSTSNSFCVPGTVWGMVVLSGDVLMMGTSKLEAGGDQESCYFSSIMCKRELSGQSQWTFRHMGGQAPIYRGHLTSLIHMGDEIACITPPSGVQVFSAVHGPRTKPSLLKKARSVAVSLQRNLVVQTEDSVQIFSIEVLASDTPGKDAQLSNVSPLGEKHVVCLRIDRRLTIIELETLRKLRPGVDALPLANPSTSTRASCGRGLVAEFGASMIIQAWQSLAPLPRWIQSGEENALLGVLSPACARIATLYSLPQWELRVKDATNGNVLAKPPPLDDGFKGAGVAYDLTFDSETEFSLKVDGPGYHVQIPYSITVSKSGQYPCKIIKGNPVPLSEPRKTPSYTLDTNCEWVLDSQSRKVCWIPPENIRRGGGGHCWVGVSLVMLGNDGVVRKLSFKELGC